MTDDMNINNKFTSETSNVVFATHTIFAKSFMNVSKIEVFTGQIFLSDKNVSLLCWTWIVFALTTSKSDSSTPPKQIDDWTHANKVCRHTLLSALSNNLFKVYWSYKEAKDIWDSLILKYNVKDVIRQRFVIKNYYRWKMIEDRDIKIQINEYQKLLEDIKAKNIALLDEFVSELLIEKFPLSWTYYK